MDLYKKLHYHVMPPVLIVVCTSFVQVASLTWKGDEVNVDNILKGIVGNGFTWMLTFCLFFWALLWLWIPGVTVYGPPSSEGVPEYKDNGVSYYFASIGTFLILEHFNPNFSQKIFENMPQFLGTLNTVAFLLCIYLYISAQAEDDSEYPKIYLFFRGRDLHPKILGVQVKQLTNCRIGLILWQLLILAFFIASCRMSSANFGAFVTLFLQSVYLFKFYVWEAGYFNTLDIILDRAGYYICWGCLVWVPCLYTSCSFYFVKHPPQTSNLFSSFCLLLGLLCIYIQYQIDVQKTNFKNDICTVIWGKQATYIEAKVTDARTGRNVTRHLLTAGYWGVARHLNYTLEIIVILFWSLPGYGLGLVPFFYPIFLSYLLVHRIHRDEKKCSEKYGKYWEKYCDQVPYRLIPYVY